MEVDDRRRRVGEDVEHKVELKMVEVEEVED